jgi:hypothetical protein
VQQATQSVLDQNGLSALEQAEQQAVRDMEPDIKRNADAFFKYMATGDWSGAAAYMMGDIKGYLEKTSKEAPTPFVQWLTAISSKQYKYEGIGKIKPLKPQFSGFYEAEVIVTNPAGQTEIWYLIMEGSGIKEGRGGPGAGK